MSCKHFLFEERIFIQEELTKNTSVFAISKKLGKTNKAVRSEIERNRYAVVEKRFQLVPCIKRSTCYLMHACDDENCNRYCAGCFRICNKPECPDYSPVVCERISHSPFVCNGCEPSKRQVCKLQKYMYQAKRAQVMADDRLKESRMGISLTPEQMKNLDDLISPLLFQGQSLKTIYMNHCDEIPISLRQLYVYVNNCYLTARNIDMPRKVRYKVRYKSNKSLRSLQKFTVGRTYADFKQYMIDNPDKSIVEMDTVIGTPGGKVLLTLLFRNSSFMIAILLENKTVDAVATALNDICEAIGIETFQRLFGVILTDRGTEFSNPLAIESDINGEIKTNVFYCDAYASWQKGMIEKNHEFIRYILPSGKSFDHLSQQDITLMMNHVNNYPRVNLNGVSPFALATLLLDQKLLKYLHYHKIKPDDVILKPMLLNKPKYKDY